MAPVGSELIRGVEDEGAGEEVLEGAPPVVDEGRQEAREEEQDREGEPDEAHQGASRAGWGSGRVDDAQVHEPHAWRLARCRPEPGEVEDIHEQPRDGQQRCDVRGRPVGVPYEGSDESDHGGSCQEDDRCERGIHRECDSARREAPVGDWRRLAGSRDLGSRASAEQAAGATLDGVVESVHAVADATGRLLGKRLRLPLDRSAHLGARQNIRERELECGVVEGFAR